MQILELINEIKDTKEKEEILKELTKIYEYKIFILRTNSTNDEIETFIKNTINKYRNELLVSDYYKSSDGDHISINTFDNLCSLENMIYNYVLRKIVMNSDKR